MLDECRRSQALSDVGTLARAARAPLPGTSAARGAAPSPHRALPEIAGVLQQSTTSRHWLGRNEYHKASPARGCGKVSRVCDVVKRGVAM